MNCEDAMALVSSQQRVRVYGHHGFQPLAEGRVIAYAEAPTITIEDDEGNRTSWQITLPIEVEHREWRRA